MADAVAFVTCCICGLPCCAVLLFVTGRLPPMGSLNSSDLLSLPSYCCCRRQSLGLPEHVKLLPESQGDVQAAQLALFQQSGTKFEHNWHNKRRKIMTESVFGREGAAADGSSSKRTAVHSGARPHGGGRVAQPSAAAVRGSPAVSAKEQLQQRVLASKRKKLSLGTS